jgi:hypothetical protein
MLSTLSLARSVMLLRPIAVPSLHDFLCIIFPVAADMASTGETVPPHFSKAAATAEKWKQAMKAWSGSAKNGFMELITSRRPASLPGICPTLSHPAQAFAEAPHSMAAITIRRIPPSISHSTFVEFTGGARRPIRRSLLNARSSPSAFRTQAGPEPWKQDQSLAG